jgi:hypothetical protein
MTLTKRMPLRISLKPSVQAPCARQVTVKVQGPPLKFKVWEKRNRPPPHLSVYFWTTVLYEYLPKQLEMVQLVPHRPASPIPAGSCHQSIDFLAQEVWLIVC